MEGLGQMFAVGAGKYISDVVGCWLIVGIEPGPITSLRSLMAFSPSEICFRDILEWLHQYPSAASIPLL